MVRGTEKELCDVCKAREAFDHCRGACGKPICSTCVHPSGMCPWCEDAATEDH